MVRSRIPIFLRAIEVCLGLLVGLLAGALGVIAFAGFAAVLRRDWGGLFAVGLGLGGCWTCSLWGWRLVMGRERKGGGLLSPFVLRAVGAFLLIAPVFGALFAGWTLRNSVGWLRLVQAVAYFAAAGGLFRLAASRERESLEADARSLGNVPR